MPLEITSVYFGYLYCIINIEKIKSLFGAQDMTVGKPTSVLIKFIIPLLIGNVAQQLCNTVDSIVVGHYIGDEALAAVGASMPILNLILALFMGVATGAGIIVSQAFGSKDRAKLSKSVGNVLTMTLIVGVIGCPNTRGKSLEQITKERYGE